jgi:diacylglycerol O-acyltransferase / wax synthase
MGLGSEWMSPVDAAWLRMDGPTNPMMITSLLLFDRPLSLEKVERVLRERLVPANARFRRVAEEPRLGLPRWVEDPHFDLRNHHHRVALPAPGGEAELRELVADLLSARLDRRRPLWDVHLVEGVGEGCAVVTRMHHAIGDGVSLIKLLLKLVDDDEHPAPAKVGQRPPAVSGVRALLRQAAAQAGMLTSLLLLPADRHTPLRGKLGPRKHAAWSNPLPVEELKELARAEGGTLHDVLAALVAGALRRHLEERAALSPGLEVRALVPVNLRSDDDQSLGNRFGLVFLPLPLSVEGAVARLREVQQRMEEIKTSSQALVALELLGALGLATSELERWGVQFFSGKATAMMTTVPGPARPVSFGGVPLSGLAVFAPGSGHVGLCVTHISYAGAVRVGISCDTQLVPDPGALVGALEAELEALRRECAARARPSF